MLRVLSCALLLAGAAGLGPDPVACAGDVVSAAGSLTQAGKSIATAVTDCPQKDKKEQCVADIGVVVSQLGAASAALSKAVEDCGGPDSKCATAISQVVSSLGSATTAASKASEECKSASKAACVADVLAAAAAVASAGSDIARAVATCAVPQFSLFDHDHSLKNFHPYKSAHHARCCDQCPAPKVKYFGFDPSRQFCFETCAAPGDKTKGLTEVGTGAGCPDQVDVAGIHFNALVRTARGAHGRLSDFFYPRK